MEYGDKLKLTADILKTEAHDSGWMKGAAHSLVSLLLKLKMEPITGAPVWHLDYDPAAALGFHYEI